MWFSGFLLYSVSQLPQLWDRIFKKKITNLRTYDENYRSLHSLQNLKNRQRIKYLFAPLYIYDFKKRLF